MMNKIKKFVKENLQLILMVLCGLLVVSGILVMVFGAGNSDGFLKVMFVIFGIVLIALGCSLLFFAMLVATNEEANFFLFDSRTKKNLPLESLTFDVINKKMTYVMTKLVSNASKVWTENVFTSNDEFFKEGEIFRPLIAYKIIYDLCDRSNESIWNLYLMADSAIINSIADALEINDDGELGKAFKFLHENASGNYERTQKFLEDNRKYIQNKMIKYVKVNVSKF